VDLIIKLNAFSNTYNALEIPADVYGRRWGSRIYICMSRNNRNNLTIFINSDALFWELYLIRKICMELNKIAAGFNYNQEDYKVLNSSIQDLMHYRLCRA
jgi:hypothetical protein